MSYLLVSLFQDNIKEEKGDESKRKAVDGEEDDDAAVAIGAKNENGDRCCEPGDGEEKGGIK